MKQAQRRHWFFFGTLMDSDILACVLGRPVAEDKRRPGILSGFERLCLVGETYPALVRRPGCAVKGIVTADISAEESRRICFFEGDEFRLQTCSVRFLNENNIALETVQALVFLAGAGLQFSQASWDFERWQRLEKDNYLLMTREFMAGYGKTDWAVLDQRWRSAQRSNDLISS